MKSRVVVFGVIVALLGALARGYQFAIEWQALQPVAGIYVNKSPFFAMLQLFLVASFLICAIGLLTQIVRKRIGLVVSVIGLICILLGHIEWYAFTKQSLRGLESELLKAERLDMMPPHPIGLVGAKWWDITILFCSVILLIWEAKTLITLFGSGPGKGNHRSKGKARKMTLRFMRNVKTF